MKILPTAYLPPAGYFSELLSAETILLEACEHYLKQTIRSRCVITGANGPLTLTVPVAHDNRWRKPIRELKIVSDNEWKRQHWKSIVSAYGKSTYFSYYEDRFREVLMKPHSFLWDLNLEMLELLCGWINLRPNYRPTEVYVRSYPDEEDLRHRWDNGETTNAYPMPYYQVFAERHGFIPGLSMIDLLFNTGPDAPRYL